MASSNYSIRFQPIKSDFLPLSWLIRNKSGWIRANRMMAKLPHLKFWRDKPSMTKLILISFPNFGKRKSKKWQRSRWPSQKMSVPDTVCLGFLSGDVSMHSTVSMSTPQKEMRPQRTTQTKKQRSKCASTATSRFLWTLSSTWPMSWRELWTLPLTGRRKWMSTSIRSMISASLR